MFFQGMIFVLAAMADAVLVSSSESAFVQMESQVTAQAGFAYPGDTNDTDISLNPGDQV